MIPKGLLIAGGVGVAGAGLFFLNRDKKPEGGGAADESKDPTGGLKPAVAGAPTDAAAPGAALPGAPAGAGTGTGAGTAALPGAGAGAGAAAGAQQVGPYTVIPDPSGMQLVIETATQKPVGVLDQQGNLTEVTVDAQGNLVPVAGGLGTGATSPQAGIGAPQSGGIPAAGAGLGALPSAQGAATGGQWGSAQFAALSQQLFANAGNGAIGSAASDGMSGATSLTGGVPAGVTGSSAPIGVSTAPTGASAQGQLTVVQDPASGANVVIDVATKQPVGVLGASGEIIPIEALAAQQQAAPQPAIGMGSAPAAF